MELLKKKNSKFYWYDFLVRGERYRGSTKETNITRAGKIAMEARGKGFTACNHAVLTDVGALHNHQVLQEIAIKSLDDSDPQVVGDAASYLKQFGSASVENVLWAHLVAWNERWRGHEKELQSVPGENMSAMYESAAGANLVAALGAAMGGHQTRRSCVA